MFDVAVVGAGMAGMATAARLQARGLSTLVLEAHGQPGGCAGFFRQRGFHFDVGATTLVDFEPGGVGGELLDSMGLMPLEAECLPGYQAWLPDGTVTLHRDLERWREERLLKLGSTPAHLSFWRLLDRLAEVFWSASRAGIKLPFQRPSDLFHAVHCIPLTDLPLARYLTWTMGDALRAHGLREDAPLCGLLAMLIEDTVHATLDTAPLINAALGVTIRGAGLMRARGGMAGFWRRFVERYRQLGGVLRVGCAVTDISGEEGAFVLHTRRGRFSAAQVVSALPIQLTARMAPLPVAQALSPFLQRDADSLGGAIVVFLGVPEDEVVGQEFTHHQLLQSYDAPLGDGNNMFISVSTPGDTESAPPGFRAVMISTHCELAHWQGLTSAEYAFRKREAEERLISLARRVYPSLGHRAVVRETGTPLTYQRYVHRPLGTVGGVRQHLGNSNQHAVPQDIGVPGFWLAGDSTWPGLGTVACVLGSRIVAEGVLKRAPRVVPSLPTGVTPAANY
ncbi:NAD(P)-binding protein [Pyxidicoccus fallax]|uniref:NAD(P)-binding protein n=1 Tax=Pyxidicoccus fallax TaxID=394095 RepID=A0A848LPM2_9BACT|nr:NAD(P)/FAD-dependent oxidoreductase [Pyxidicoccus fallax]NMO19533.1 NAD(P)-binding protein [Pyxidicoccus fallax]NPC82327.1 NAD(P)-binding protein [Pyxidicoccus fallax]